MHFIILMNTYKYSLVFFCLMYQFDVYLLIYQEKNLTIENQDFNGTTQIIKRYVLFLQMLKLLKYIPVCNNVLNSFN